GMTMGRPLHRAGAYLPDFDRAVLAGRGQRAAVRAESGPANELCMTQMVARCFAFAGLEQSSGLRLPDFNHVRLTGHGEKAAVLAIDGPVARVPAREDLPPGGAVQDFDGSVRAEHSQAQPVRTEGHVPARFAQGHDLLTGRHIPKLEFPL